MRTTPAQDAETPVLQAVLRRDRVVVGGGLAVVVVLAWWHMAHESAGGMGASMSPTAWGLSEVGLTFLMWAVMMMAMMIPSAAPMILLVALIYRRRHGRLLPTALFLAGYAVVWTGFAVVMTGGQWALHEASMTSAMGSVAPVLGGAVLVAAGAYQWTPFKDACLRHCRTPLGFLMTEWRDGIRGAFVMGARHGGFCLGCCWALMALMFVGGVMNLLWMAGIAVYILIEKVAPAAERVGRIAGVALVVWGLSTLVPQVGGST